LIRLLRDDGVRAADLDPIAEHDDLLVLGRDDDGHRARRAQLGLPGEHALRRKRHGGNLGDDATYSGTVAGALEATILGVPGIALSLVARDNFDFKESAMIAVAAARKVLEEGLPEGTLLNINIPPGEIKGVKVTRQGIKNARPVITEHIDPRGKPYFWIGEEYFSTNSAEGTDYHAVELGYVSVTPLRSDMTDHQALTAIETWNYLRDSELLHKS